MENDKANILLIYPGESELKPRLPMAVLTLGTHSIAEGYKCKIIDERVVPLSDDDIKSADLIGISTMWESFF